MPVRDFLGQGYAATYNSLRENDATLDDLTALLETPFFAASYRVDDGMPDPHAIARDQVKSLIDVIMARAYKHMTLSMDHAVTMALERLVVENKRVVSLPVFYQYVGAAAEVIYESAHHANHLTPENIALLKQGLATPEAVYAIKSLHRIGIIKSGSKKMKIYEDKLHAVPTPARSSRFVNPTRVVMNEIEFFPEVTAMYTGKEI